MDLITVTREEGLKFSVRLRDHVMTTDMSVAEGGNGDGPSPVEYLGVASGACLAMVRVWVQDSFWGSLLARR